MACRQSSTRSLNRMRSSSGGSRGAPRHSRPPFRRRSTSRGSRDSWHRSKSRSSSIRSVTHRRRSSSRSSYHRSRSPRRLHSMTVEPPEDMSANMMQGKSQFPRKGKTPPRSNSRESRGRSPHRSPHRSHSGGSHRSNSSRKSDADRPCSLKRHKSSFSRGLQGKRPPSNHSRSSPKGKWKRD